jgi:acid phosphatase
MKWAFVVGIVVSVGLLVLNVAILTQQAPPVRAAVQRHHHGDDDADDGSGVAPHVPHQHHHKAETDGVGKPRFDGRASGKRRGKSLLNVNRPDDMHPATTTAAQVPLTANGDGVPSATFFVIGDQGGPGRDPQRDVAKAMAATARKLPPVPAWAAHAQRTQVAFIVSTGDNIYEDGPTDAHDPKFARNFEKVYTAAELQCRWYMSLGNHDHGAHGLFRDALAEVNYTRRSKKWYMPSTYYVQRFDFAAAADGAAAFSMDLVVMDTYDVSPHETKVSAAQLAWLDRTLAASTATWKLVVGHRPMYSAGSLHGSSRYMQDHVGKVLHRHKASAYFSGDDHTLQLIDDGAGVLHAVSGAGARAKSTLRKDGLPGMTRFQRVVHGFMAVAITEKQLAVSVVGKDGDELFHLVHPRADGQK